MPKEDRSQKKLVFFCKPCNYTQDAESPIVFRHEAVKSERWVALFQLFLPPPPPPYSLLYPATTPPSAPRSNQLAKVPDDIITDPTLLRERVKCPKCSNDTAVMILPPVGASDNRIKIIFVCTAPGCIHKWQR